MKSSNLRRRLLSATILLAAAGNLFAGATVNWISGGPNTGFPKGSGYRDGDITTDAEYNGPRGIAMDITGNYLLVADQTNNAIRILEFDDNTTGTLLTFAGANQVSNLIRSPIGVAIDESYNIYVLNRGNGKNGNVITFDYTGELIATNMANITNAAGIALDPVGNIYVTASNRLFEITAPGISNLVVAIPNAGASLQGLVVKHNGLLAVCDSGRNGIYLINPNTSVVTTNAGFNGRGDFISTANNVDIISRAKFFQPMGVAETGDGDLIVSDFGNHRVKVITSTTVTNLYGVISNDWVTPFKGFVDGTVSAPDNVGGVAARQPYGVVFAPDGTVYVTEDYYHIIRHVSKDGFSLPPPPPPAAPSGLIATPGYGFVTLTWSPTAVASNYNVKRSTFSGGETTIAVATNNTFVDRNVIDGINYFYQVSALNVSGEGPNSAEVSAMPLFSPAPTNLTVTATSIGVISLAWAPSAGATGYNVKRSTSTGPPYTNIAVNISATSYNDTSVINGTPYFYVVSAINPGGENPTNSAEVTATAPLPPVPSPQIGWVSFPPNPPNIPTSVFNVGTPSGLTFNNDVPIVIIGASGSQTFYNYANTPSVTNVLDPTSSSFSAPVGYADGQDAGTVAGYTVAQIEPSLAIKAIGEQSGRSNSAIVSALFQFVVANPLVIGTNAAQFVVSNLTVGAQMYYTIDGSVPSSTNTSAVGPVTNGAILSIPISNGSNATFEIIGYKGNYQSSAVVTNVFAASNFVANTISFGFASGEASSDFVASPGQTFYAPVTLSPLSGATIYSLQFNATVTNINSGPPITPGAFLFTSMLEKPDLDDVGTFLTIPPFMFINTNSLQFTNTVFYENSTNWVSLLVTNLSENLLGVGWLERAGATNLYPTTTQDLIKYSQAHDTLFLEGNGKVILGGYAFQVPGNATLGQTNYEIQIGRPSATSDGIGAPGSSVMIFAPTNGSLGGGAINAIKDITIGQRTYVAGNSYPFRWFNAGDFGNTNLQDADVEQVFQSAIYGLNYPPFDERSFYFLADGEVGFTNVSDFYDSMDSAGTLGVLDSDPLSPYNGFYTNAGALTIDQLNAVMSSDYTTMDQIAFGDGALDVADVFVTYVRSIDPSRTWYQRFWLGGQRVAETVPNVVHNVVSKKTVASKVHFDGSGLALALTNTPVVNFAAGDFQGTAGQTIQIPVTANVLGPFPMRVAMLNISVVPLDGSPALTTPIQFNNFNPALGTPWTTDSQGIANASVVWLNAPPATPAADGVSNNAVIGTLTIKIPTNATASSAYGIHFDHASGSPSGFASFPKHTLTGLITLSSRTNSSYHDGIPDSWRLRYFGTLNNLLSKTNADADGDGVDNLHEYLTGTDPSDSGSFFKNAGVDQSAATGNQDSVVSWPSVSGKTYVIERSPTLFPAVWTSISTNNGTGGNMEIHDTSGGNNRYYRVRVQ